MSDKRVPVVLGTLVLLLVGSAAMHLESKDAAASSTLKEAGADLTTGTFNGTTRSSDSVALNGSWNASLNYNTWTNMNPSYPQPDYYGQAMDYDSGRDVLVVFGGEYRDIYTNDTWIYNYSLNNWTNMNPPVSPPGRAFSAMAYDFMNGVSVLFGGLKNTGGGYYDDTWLYNSSVDTWKEVFPVLKPSGRVGHAMAYDSRNGLIVLFGGENYGTLGDTWTFDVSTTTWTRQSTTGPIGRHCPNGLAYDSKNGVMFLYGGYTNQRELFLNDTWEYNLSTNNWTELYPASKPRDFENHDLSYDSQNDVVILFGGDGDNPGNQSEDTWMYDPGQNNWTNMTTAYRPSNHNGAGGPRFTMAYDSGDRVTILVGGLDTEPYGATYAYHLGSREYSPSGTYTSPKLDLAGEAYFGCLEWNATVPQGTSLGFQIRTADTTDGLESAPFLGPDGSSDTFYQTSGQNIEIPKEHAQWMQYRAFLDTDNSTITPQLQSIMIRFNLVQQLSIISPAGGENWTGLQHVNWTASDKDGDALTIDIYLLDGENSTLLASNLSGDATSWEWNTTEVSNGSYKIMVSALDNDPNIPLEVNATTAEFTIFHPAPSPEAPNHAPEIEALTAPNNTKVGASETLTFSVDAVDVDGNSLTYDWQENGKTLSTQRTFQSKFPPGVHTVILLIGNGHQTTTKTFVFTVKPAPKPSETQPAYVSGMAMGAASVAIITVMAIGLFITAGTEVGKFGLMAFLLPLYSRIHKEEVFDNENRGMIRGFIYADPGIHFNEILRRLKLGNGSAAHHLVTLEREGFIKSRSDGYLKRFYPAEMKIVDMPVKLPKLQKAILETVQESEGMSERDIARVLEMSYSTANRHVKKLAELGILRLEKHGIQVKCYLADNTEQNPKSTND